MTVKPQTLSRAFEGISDFRDSRGKRYELHTVLLLSLAAMLQGAKSEQAIADWSQTSGRRWLGLFGIRRRRGPSLATINRIFRGVNPGELDHAISHWSDRFTRSAKPGPENSFELLARLADQIKDQMTPANMDITVTGSQNGMPFESLGEAGLKIWGLDYDELSQSREMPQIKSEVVENRVYSLHRNRI